MAGFGVAERSRPDESLDLRGVLVIVIVTAIGGTLRDVFGAEDVPLIVRRDAYATAVIAGAAFYLARQKIGLGRPFAAAAGWRR